MIYWFGSPGNAGVINGQSGSSGLAIKGKPVLAAESIRSEEVAERRISSQRKLKAQSNCKLSLV
jgi:hypothetical protein